MRRSTPMRIWALAGFSACAALAGGAVAAPVTITGNAKDNRLVGTPTPDLITAKAGKDTVLAMDGDDSVFAGPGADHVQGGRGSDTVRGGPGADKLFGERGPDRVEGGPGPDRISGGTGDDRAFGGPGNDTIYANLGRDESHGGKGNDDLWAVAEGDVYGRGDKVGDKLFGGPGDDKLHTRDGEVDRVKCGPGRDAALLDRVDKILDASRGNPKGSCEVVKRAGADGKPPNDETGGGPTEPGPLPSPDFGPGIDPYARYDGQGTCDPAPKPGVEHFSHLVLRASPGTGSSGISRACDVGGKSEHKEGRAWDWSASVYNAHQREQVEEVLAQLLATDRHGNRHALARRVGIMYIIWNRRIWRAYSPGPGWASYSGSNPHTDHVHFSFSWAGARKNTSYWGKVGG